MRLIDVAAIGIRRRSGIAAVGLVILLLSATPSLALRAAQPGPRTFASPEQAAAALAEACSRGDQAELLKIFGTGAAKLISSGDPVADAHARQRLAAAYNASHKVEFQGDERAVLSVGTDDFPLPIPLVKQGSAWHFDTKQGEQEIFDRRIGDNELTAIAVSHAYVEAQREYAAMHRLANGQGEYAQKFHSSPGNHDGLYWEPENASDESPLGPLVANARAEGYRATPEGTPTPYHGYYFRILARQGPAAAGGAKEYIVNGRMTGGFALLAFPAKWGDSGIMTFIVDQDGIVFEKNLGPGTEAAARAVAAYDPDQGWKPTH